MNNSAVNAETYDSITLALKKIAERIKESSRGRTLFDAPEHLIIIPSKVNRSFVEMALADRGAALARVYFDTLDWSVLRLAKEMGAENIGGILTQRDVFAHLLMLLSKPEEIAGYIEDPGEKQKCLDLISGYLAPGKTDSKKYSLAFFLSRLFVKYAEECPGLFEEWETKDRWNEASGNIAEPFEFALYKALREKGSFVLKDLKEDRKTIRQGFRVHVLGYSYIPGTALEGLGSLAEAGTDITVYTPTPRVYEGCKYGITDAWNAVNEKADGSFRACGVKIPPKEKQTAEELKEALKDKVAAVIPCPGPCREAEAVWSSICYHLDKKLCKPDEICVLVCDTDKYYPEMERVFAGRSIPFNMACVRPSHGSDYLSGVTALFDLAASNLERYKAEALFTNACFLNRHGLTGETVSKWLERMEELGVWEFFDLETKQARYPHLRGEDHTWKKAALRVRLSVAADRVWQDLLPDGNHRDEVQRLLALTELLWDDIRTLRALDAGRETAENAAVFKTVKTVIGNWLRPLKQESSMKEHTEKRLQEFQTQCQLRNYTPSTGDIRSFLETFTDPMQFSRGRAFTEGVMTGHIRNIRMPSFKLLYLMGFNEDNFPGRDDASSLDLSRKFCGTGATDPVIDGSVSNRHGFLKAVLSAEKVYITYDCRDRKKDVPLYPSPCVAELMDLCGLKPEKELPLFARENINLDNKDRDWTLTYHEGDLEEAAAERGDWEPEDSPGTDSAASAERPAGDTPKPAVADYLRDPGEYLLRRTLGYSDFGEGRKKRKYIAPSTDAPDKWRYEQEAYRLFVLTKESSWEDAVREAYGLYRLKGLAPEGALAETERDLFKQEAPSFPEKLKQGHGEGFAEKAFQCRVGEVSGFAAEVSDAAIVGEAQDRETVFLPKKIADIKKFIEAYALGAAYLLSRDPAETRPLYIAGVDDERLLWDGTDNTPSLEDFRDWLAGVCEDMAPEGYYCAPAELFYKLLYKKESNAFAPYESGDALLRIYLEDVAKDIAGQHPFHYWHRLLKDFPDRIKAPSREEYEKTVLRLKPVFEAFDKFDNKTK